MDNALGVTALLHVLIIPVIFVVNNDIITNPLMSPARYHDNRITADEQHGSRHQA